MNRNGTHLRRLWFAPSLVGLGLAASACGPVATLPGWQPEADAPAAVDRLWKPADTPSASLTDLPAIDRTLPERESTQRDQPYDLPDLVDLALGRNPETRRAWAEAHVAAAGVGRAIAPYYPTLGASAEWGPQRFENRTSPTSTTVHQDFSTPAVKLTWALIDFGRRSSSLEGARQQLLATGLAFNREVQTVVFRTQAAFFLYDAARARVVAAEQNFALARTVREAVAERLDVGLATEPANLLARQAEAQAAYAVEDAKAKVDDARAALAIALGVPANLPFEVVSLASQKLPLDLDADVDQLIDAAVKQRPDLGARVAALREREAAVARARAELYPEFGFVGVYGVDLSEFSLNGAPPERPNAPAYSALLGVQWKLFEGFDRLNAIRQAEAQTVAARSSLAAAELDAIAMVWRAYSDFRAAQKKLSFAEALLRASQDAYDASVDGYRQGVATITQLLDAESDLANSRYTLIDTRAALLVSSAAIAYATGAVDPGAASVP